MTKVIVPPIKCQGIKTKLVPLILANARIPRGGRWIEPFMGSAVVGLNARPGRALFGDLNPHVVNFYAALSTLKITPLSARAYLEENGRMLAEIGQEHYYYVRERFNKDGSPLDFLFLSRACFNGMIRFNSKGYFNVPFCRKPQRFTKSYVTKIVNQLAGFQDLLKANEWAFVCQDFAQTIGRATQKDFIYCDPPYLGRHVDYFDSWDAGDEKRLFDCLSTSKAKFILSTWHSNRFRTNESLGSLWKGFHVVTQEHFYHVGAKEENRNSMVEALVMNFHPRCEKIEKQNLTQSTLFDLVA